MNEEKDTALQVVEEEAERKKRVNRAAFAAGKKEKEGKHRRWLFLLVDVLLLAAIVAAILFLISLLTPIKLFDSPAEEVRALTYTIEIKGVDKATMSALHAGDEVIDKKTGAVIGVVSGIDSRAYEVFTDMPSSYIDETLNSHVVVKLTYPDEFNTITVTLTAEAVYESGVGYTVDDCRIAVGREYELYFPGYAGEGVCVGLRAE